MIRLSQAGLRHGMCAWFLWPLFLGLAMGLAAAGLPEDSGCAQRPPSNVVTFVCSSDVDVQVVGSTQDALRTLPGEVFHGMPPQGAAGQGRGSS